MLVINAVVVENIIKTLYNSWGYSYPVKRNKPTIKKLNI